MAIHIEDTMLNKEYILKGIHKLNLSFKGRSSRNGDPVNILIRLKNTELICLVEDGREKSEIRYTEKFNHDLQPFELDLTIKQFFTPDEPVFAGFLISVRDVEGQTASEEFVLQCR